MKKFVLTLVVLLTGLIPALSQVRSLPTLENKMGTFYLDGQELTPQQLEQLVGSEIFDQTYTPASRQLKASKILYIAGGVTAGVGLIGTIAGSALILSSKAGQKAAKGGQITEKDVDQQAIAGSAVTMAGGILLGLGGAALSVAIPLNVIGASRLNWIQNQFNEKQLNASFGLQPNGIGFSLQF